jgi:hypothetical protein
MNNVVCMWFIGCLFLLFLLVLLVDGPRNDESVNIARCIVYGRRVHRYNGNGYW